MLVFNETFSIQLFKNGLIHYKNKTKITDGQNSS